MPTGYTPVPEPGTPERPTAIAQKVGSLRRARALATEVVLETDDVVKLRRRDLDQLAPFDGLESMDAARPYPP